MAVHFQEGKKSSVSKCGLFLMYSSVEKKLFFQHGNQSYFLLGFAEKIVLQFAIHPCLLCVQKIRNQRFSSVLQKQE